MKFSIPATLAVLAVTYAAPITVTSTKYVVATTYYTTLTINNAPSAIQTAELISSTKAEESASTPITTATSVTTSTAEKATTSTTSTSSSESDIPLNFFEEEILAEHNKKRALHNVPALSWDTNLAKYAADYAAKTFKCDNVRLIHSFGEYGENLAAGYVGGAAPVDVWYDEIHLYNYSRPGYSLSTGHFTQLIWASTTHVGCAMVKCDNSWRQYTICEYSPQGNLVSATTNYFEFNVLPVV